MIDAEICTFNSCTWPLLEEFTGQRVFQDNITSISFSKKLAIFQHLTEVGCTEAICKLFQSIK